MDQSLLDWMEQFIRGGATITIRYDACDLFIASENLRDLEGEGPTPDAALISLKNAVEEPSDVPG